MTVDVSTSESIDLLLEGWSGGTTHAPHSAGGISFGVDDEPLDSEASEEPTYCIDLPDDMSVAQELLDKKDHMLQVHQSNLDSAERSLQSLLSGERDVHERGPGITFGVGDSDEEDSGTQVQQILARLNALISSYARIETRTAGQLLGTTQVGWSGDFLTVWAPATTPEKMQLHFHSVRQALRQRMSIVRLVALVMTGATGLAVKWCMPGGSLLMLPAAWRFVRDVLKEVQSLRQEAAR